MKEKVANWKLASFLFVLLVVVWWFAVTEGLQHGFTVYAGAILATLLLVPAIFEGIGLIQINLNRRK